MGFTRTDFYLGEDLTTLLAAALRPKTRAEVYSGDRYIVLVEDLGDGLLMDNGLYANLLSTGGSLMITKFASAVIQIAQGTTADVVLPTPPLGQRLVLTLLAAQGTVQTNVTTVTVNSVDIMSGKLAVTSQQANLAAQLMISGNGPSQQPIVCGVDQIMTLRFDVATSSISVYSYQFEGLDE